MSLEYADDVWSDSDNESPTPSMEHLDPKSLQKQIRELSNKLALSNRALEEYREMMGKYLGSPTQLSSVRDESLESSKSARDDDTHYFKSYSDNGTPLVLLREAELRVYL